MRELGWELSLAPSSAPPGARPHRGLAALGAGTGDREPGWPRGACVSEVPAGSSSGPAVLPRKRLCRCCF